MTIARPIALVVAATTSAAVSAAVTPTDPFTGDAFETFEAIAPPGGVPGPVEILGGAGTFNDTLANNLIITVNLISFLTNEEIFAWNGNFMGCSVTGWTTYTFDEPAYSFGGYIGTVDEVAGGTVRFYDEGGALIEQLDFNLPLNEWAWYGWSSDVPFTKVEFQGDPTPGKPVVYDDLQVSFTPPTVECEGDVSGDNMVDSIDLNLMLGEFGCTDGCGADLDGDGDTDSADLNILLGAFGDVCDG